MSEVEKLARVVRLGLQGVVYLVVAMVLLGVVSGVLRAVFGS